ncbi:MAG: sigma factor-like helix-turn-helix DNA-binding protein, partial [Woeseiaceae bacterium]|nr:sigma factor-like helix-turn-helix DNA-binding protein [Woeseiaceae bacterium]
AAASEDTDFLNECVSRLSGSQRQSIALAFFQGLTHAELAQRLTLPLGTIKSRLRRGLKRLKQCLDDLGYRNELHT